MAGRQRRHADHVHVVLDRLPGDLRRRPEQAADVHVEADVCERSSDHLRAPVVPVLSKFRDQDPRPAAMAFGELRRAAAQRGEFVVTGPGPGIGPAGHLHQRRVAAEDTLHGERDLAHGRPGAGRVDAERQQVGVVGSRPRVQGIERPLAGLWVPFCPDRLQALHLAQPHLFGIDGAYLHASLLIGAIPVHTHQNITPFVQTRLTAGGGGFDAEFRHPALHRPRHAAQLLDLVDQRARRAHQLSRQVFHVVGPAERIDRPRHTGFFLEDQLRVPRNPGRRIRGQSDGLVKRIRVKGLGTAQDGRQCLDRRAHHVVQGVLLRQRHARGLAVHAEHQRTGVARREHPRHAFGPQYPGSAQLGGLHEEIHADAEEERQPRRELIDLEPTPERGPHVFESIRQRERQLLHRRRPGFVHVIAGNRYGIEPGHVGSGVGDHVGHDSHRWSGRIDVRVPDHELLEDVILDRAGEGRGSDSLFLSRDDVRRHHRQHRPVHGHGHAHLVERNAVEQDLHVLDRIDRNTRLSDITLHARMVGVVPAVGGQIEGHGKALLTGGEISPVERIGLLGRGEARILADGPWSAREHGGPRTPQEGSESRQPLRESGITDVRARIERLDVDAFRRCLHMPVGVAAIFMARALGPFGQVRNRERIGHG